MFYGEEAEEEDLEDSDEENEEPVKSKAAPKDAAALA